MDLATTARNGRRIGELADSAGVTVRTLHYYDEIGLLTASQRTDSGHRLYTDADGERLSRICLLRRLGLSLADIERAIDDPAWDLHSAMSVHLVGLERRLEVEGRLRRRLKHLVAGVESSQRSLTAEVIAALEEMTTLETPVHRRISILVYADLEAMFDYLIGVFGLGPGELTRDGTGRVVHGSVEAGDGDLWLHPESPEFGLASPRTLGAATATTAVMVDDVDAHCRRAKKMGADVLYGPIDQPYGYREYGARDPEGGLWSFMKQLDQDTEHDDDEGVDDR